MDQPKIKFWDGKDYVDISIDVDPWSETHKVTMLIEDFERWLYAMLQEVKNAKD